MKPNETSADYKAHLAAIAERTYETSGPIRNPGPGFYVSAIDNGRKALVEGPFPTHMEALAAVDGVKEAWHKADPRSFWYAWGTAQVRA